MIKKECYAFIKRKNLINRIVDMLYYFKIFDSKELSSKNAYIHIKENILDIYFVENLSKYFEQKMKTNNKKIQLRCNLLDLINDLDFLKQYLDD